MLSELTDATIAELRKLAETQIGSHVTIRTADLHALLDEREVLRAEVAQLRRELAWRPI